MTDSNGNEVNAYDYDPFGVILNTGTNSVVNPFQYEGGYFESSTGLVKFGTRYYNPNLGRWTQQDPVQGSLSSPDSLNRYLYGMDDPVNEVDPSGKAITPLCILGVIGSFISVIVASFQGTPYLLALLDAALASAELAPFILPAIIAALAIIGAGALFTYAILYCAGVP